MGAEGDSAPGHFSATSVLGSLPKCPEEVGSLCTSLPLQALPRPPLLTPKEQAPPWASGGVDCPVLGRRQVYPKCSLSCCTVSELCDRWGGTPFLCISDTSAARVGSQVVTPQALLGSRVLGKSKRCDDPSLPGGVPISQTGVQAGE